MPISPTQAIALALVAVMLVFDIADAEMNGGTTALLVVGWSYVAWKAFLRRATLNGLYRVKTFKLTYEGRPIQWGTVVSFATLLSIASWSLIPHPKLPIVSNVSSAEARRHTGTHGWTNYHEFTAGSQAAHSKPSPPFAHIHSQVAGCDFRHHVQAVTANGEFVQLEDGSLWQIDKEDRSHTNLWRSMENVFVCNSSLVNVDSSASEALGKQVRGVPPQLH